MHVGIEAQQLDWFALSQCIFNFISKYQYSSNTHFQYPFLFVLFLPFFDCFSHPCYHIPHPISSVTPHYAPAFFFHVLHDCTKVSLEILNSCCISRRRESRIFQLNLPFSMHPALATSQDTLSRPLQKSKSCEPLALS